MLTTPLLSSSAEKVSDEYILSRHEQSQYKSNLRFQCDDCVETFNSEEFLKHHVDTNHQASQLENTFFNPSLAKSKFACQPCDKALPDENVCFVTWSQNTVNAIKIRKITENQNSSWGNNYINLYFHHYYISYYDFRIISVTKRGNVITPFPFIYYHI